MTETEVMWEKLSDESLATLMGLFLDVDEWLVGDTEERSAEDMLKIVHAVLCSTLDSLKPVLYIEKDV